MAGWPRMGARSRRWVGSASAPAGLSAVRRGGTCEGGAGRRPQRLPPDEATSRTPECATVWGMGVGARPASPDIRTARIAKRWGIVTMGDTTTTQPEETAATKDGKNLPAPRPTPSEMPCPACGSAMPDLKERQGEHLPGLRLQG
jgi:hypothetical protein